MQDVFVIAWRRWDSLFGEEQARAWLAGIAVRVLSNHRSLARHRVEAISDALPEIGVPGFDPKVIDGARNVRRFLLRLRPKLREVFVRFAFCGQSVQEIANDLNIKLTTVYARLRTARNRLARIAG
jgi:RNA polymerase sigma-70 factor, ECF subfamily